MEDAFHRASDVFVFIVYQLANKVAENVRKNNHEQFQIYEQFRPFSVNIVVTSVVKSFFLFIYFYFALWIDDKFLTI